MLYLLILGACVVQTCLGGVYPGGLSSAEAHGPLARLALNSMGGVGGLQFYGSHPASVSVAPVAAGLPVAQLRQIAAPVPVASVPIAAVPVAPYPVAPARLAAPVDVVHHVPTVADVPVTKYYAQPGVIQKIVDVTKTKVATAKLQVRRPAIQKQFYDIEERTVVRPVGSAVVELEEPISKNFVSPFTVVPSGQHTVAQYQRPFAYPAASYPFVSYAPFQVPVQAYPPSFIQQTQGITQLPQIPQQPRPPQAPRPPQQPFPPAPQPPQQPFPPAPQPPQQPFPSAPQPPQQPFPSAPQPPLQFPSFPQPIDSPDNSESSEFDSSDTVVVDNPDFERSRGEEIEESQRQLSSFDNVENGVQEQRGNENARITSSQADNSPSNQQVLDEFQSRQLLRQFFRQQDFAPAQRSQPSLQNLQPTQTQQISNLQRSQELQSNEPSQRSQSEPFRQEQFPTGSPTPSVRTLNPQNYPKPQTRTYSSEGQIPSVRTISSEEAQDNQQKLIELLTGRSEISEVNLSRSGVSISPVGDAGVVRGRVLSVTPAPRSSEGEERVSTRRVVVSRPIQTLEEVDVHQPFSHVERVAVHEPALLKTAHTHVARVPTAVPVLSRTLAPVLYH